MSANQFVSHLAARRRRSILVFRLPQWQSIPIFVRRCAKAVVARRAFEAEQGKQRRFANIRNKAQQQPPARVIGIVQTAHGNGASGHNGCQRVEHHHIKRQPRLAQIASADVVARFVGQRRHQPHRQRKGNAYLHQRKPPVFLAPCVSAEMGVLFSTAKYSSISLSLCFRLPTRGCLQWVLRRLLRHKTASAALKILAYGWIGSHFRLASAIF